MSWWWVLLQYYSVLQSTTPVLTCTTKYYSSTNLYYKVLLQYYPVLQSTTPVLLCTTKYYSNTTLYYKDTTLYYKAQCSLYYSNTTLYYKVPLKYYSVLLQYYLVLQSTTPVLPRTKLLQSTSWLIRITYETSFTMRRATKGSLQLQQILCLPRKLNLMIDPHHIWNVIYNAQSNRHRLPTSPNTAPATQNESHDWSTSHMKRHLQCAEQQSTPSNLTKYCACHAKWISWLIHITYETSSTMRRATGITLQLHQILRLPRKMNLMIDPHHIWNVIYNARSDRHHPPTSPTTAPATQKECHDWSASHLKRHLQCAEWQASPCNLTKYCACHAKGVSWLIRITYETSFTMRGATGITLQPQILRLPRKIALPNLTEIYWKQLKWHFQCATDPRISERDPSMIRPWKRKTEPAAPPRLLFALARSRFYWKLQRFPLRLSFQISPHPAPATKSDTWTPRNAAPATKSDTWTPPNAAPATKSDTWTSPNAAPATKSDTKWNMTTTTTTTTTTTRTTTTRTTTTTTTTTRTTTTTTGTTTTRTTTAATTTATTTTATTTTARTTIPVRLPKSSYIGSLPLNFLW